jgi:hypothetical protein
MKWHAALRNLILYGGVLALSIAFVICCKTEGFPVGVALRIVLFGSVSCIGGYGLGNIVITILSQRGFGRAKDFD